MSPLLLCFPPSTRQLARAFNQPLSFDTSSVTVMYMMFDVRSARALPSASIVGPSQRAARTAAASICPPASLLACRRSSHASRSTPQGTNGLSDANKLLIRCAWSGSATFVSVYGSDSEWSSLGACPTSSPPSPPPPPPPSAPASVCGQEVLLDLGAACQTILQNNLGGQGPDNGAEELRFGRAGSFAGRPFDLVFKTTGVGVGGGADGSYVKGADSITNGCPDGGGFGKIGMRRSQKAGFTLTFRDSVTNDPVVLPAFRFAFMDIDAGSNAAWQEHVFVTGYNGYTLDDNTYLAVTNGNEGGRDGIWVASTDAYASSSADNPSDPEALTATQRRLTVTFEFLSTSQVHFTLQSGRPTDYAPNHKGGAFFFTGSTNMLAPCPPAMPPPPSPPLPPPRPSLPPQPQQQRLATNVQCLPIRSDEALLDFSGAKPQAFPTLLTPLG